MVTGGWDAVVQDLGRRHRVAVGVDEMDLAEVELAQRGLDLGAVAHDHPDQLVGLDDVARRPSVTLAAVCARTRSA